MQINNLVKFDGNIEIETTAKQYWHSNMDRRLFQMDLDEFR
jgi:hypothetical protein